MDLQVVEVDPIICWPWGLRIVVERSGGTIKLAAEAMERVP